MWSLKCYDWKHQSAERLIARLTLITERRVESRRGGEIVLLHDGDARRQGADRRHVLAALEYWLPRWRDAGFEFVTMNQVAAGWKTAP
jgi:peptidoglycan/xylan/chitin deacetylase (PgdA/CDA1 family)